MYEMAMQMQKEENKEEKWFEMLKKSSEKGYLKATHKTGMQYVKKKNKEEAIKQLERAIEKGYSESKLQLALIYEQGNLVEQNLEKSVLLFQSACKDNHSKSMFYFAVFKLKHFEHEMLDIVDLLERSCDLGYSRSFYRLSLIYYRGNKYIEKDFPKALLLLEKSSEKG